MLTDSGRHVQIAPSILAADFGHMAQEVEAVTLGGADMIHVDIMDGQFVPNLTMGPDMVRSVRKATQLPIDVHLMVREPERHLEKFAEAGADLITIHVEATSNVQAALHAIRKLGKRAGLAMNPHTSEASVENILDELDVILVMTINPGFSGQAFLPGMLPKLTRTHRLVAEAGHAISIEVDGGIGPKTASVVAQAGAEILVAGTAVFAQPDRQRAITAIRTAARGQ
ncbi:MAG TPA: ribulose-phosphate 3-epimerase [Polyangiaceae bacterium]|nr:ribulose-phosphate 3-epimerase [Polyangiaceae bacterium]